MLSLLLLLVCPGILVDALPFLTTWRTVEDNEIVLLPPLQALTSVTINWGDSSTDSLTAGFTNQFNHTFATAGDHNVSIDGRIRWGTANFATYDRAKLVDIRHWGDGFVVGNYIGLFQYCTNLSVSAPPESQPVFLAAASCDHMFSSSSFNSALNWDLKNVTNLQYMFANTPLNSPINFTRTKEVISTYYMFYGASNFNQPITFDDASGLQLADYMFASATAFNQPVILPDSRSLQDMRYMFANASSFNSPIMIRTDAVKNMFYTFYGATSFNQPVSDFNTSNVENMQAMFYGATNFNQPINFQTNKLTSTSFMFALATTFNQPVRMAPTNLLFSAANMFDGAIKFTQPLYFSNTSGFLAVNYMFRNARAFYQDLGDWDVAKVVQCSEFCVNCVLPNFNLGQCTPCSPRYMNEENRSVCYSGTRSPTPPTTKYPTTNSPTRVPTRVPTTGTPTTLIPTPSPTTLSPSSSPTTRGPTTLTPTKLPSTGYPTKVPTSKMPTALPPSFMPTASPTTATFAVSATSALVPPAAALALLFLITLA